MAVKFVTTDQLNKVFSSYDLSTRNASLIESEYYDKDSVIYISDAEKGNWVYAQGKLYGDDYAIKDLTSVNWVVLPDDTSIELELSDNTIIADNCILYSSSELLIPADITKFNTEYVDSKYLQSSQKYGIITFADNLTEIKNSSAESYLFTGNITNYIKLPESLTTIGLYAFNISNSSIHIEIPSNVTYIASKCFSNLKYITFNKIYSTYTNEIISDNNCKVRFIDVDENCFSDDYNISIIFKKGSQQKGTQTYQIYTDNETIKEQLTSASVDVTVFNIHKLNEWKVL